jgi:hypothetical protein
VAVSITLRTSYSTARELQTRMALVCVCVFVYMERGMDGLVHTL